MLLSIIWSKIFYILSIAFTKTILSFYRMVPSTIWEIFSQFLVFCKLFHKFWWSNEILTSWIWPKVFMGCILGLLQNSLHFFKIRKVWEFSETDCFLKIRSFNRNISYKWGNFLFLISLLLMLLKHLSDRRTSKISLLLVLTSFW